MRRYDIEREWWHYALAESAVPKERWPIGTEIVAYVEIAEGDTPEAWRERITIHRLDKP